MPLWTVASIVSGPRSIPHIEVFERTEKKADSLGARGTFAMIQEESFDTRGTEASLSVMTGESAVSLFLQGRVGGRTKHSGEPGEGRTSTV